MDYFIDTNIFLRVLIQEDKKVFTDCKKLLELVKKNSIRAYTSNLVLAEVNWTLNSYYQLPKGDVVKALKSIINLNGLSIMDEYDAQNAISLYENETVKYIDAVLASISQIASKQMTFISYDRDFDKLNVLRVEPQIILEKYN